MSWEIVEFKYLYGDGLNLPISNTSKVPVIDADDVTGDSPLQEIARSPEEILADILVVVSKGII